MPSRAGQSRERLRTLIPARFQGSPPIHAVTVQYSSCTDGVEGAYAPQNCQEKCQANVPQKLPGKMFVFWLKPYFRCPETLFVFQRQAC